MEIEMISKRNEVPREKSIPSFLEQIGGVEHVDSRNTQVTGTLNKDLDVCTGDPNIVNILEFVAGPWFDAVQQLTELDTIS